MRKQPVSVSVSRGFFLYLVWHILTAVVDDFLTAGPIDHNICRSAKWQP